MYSNNLGMLPPRPMAPMIRGRPMMPVAPRPMAPMPARAPMMRTPPRAWAPPAALLAQRAAEQQAARNRAIAQRVGYRAGHDARIRSAVDAAIAARGLTPAQAAATSSVVYPTSPAAVTTPSVPVSSGSPEADLTPHQDASSDAAEAAAPSPEPKSHKTLFIVGGVLAAAVVGVVVVKKIRASKKHGHSHRGE